MDAYRLPLQTNFWRTRGGTLGAKTMAIAWHHYLLRAQLFDILGRLRKNADIIDSMPCFLKKIHIYLERKGFYKDCDSLPADYWLQDVTLPQSLSQISFLCRNTNWCCRMELELFKILWWWTAITRPCVVYQNWNWKKTAPSEHISVLPLFYRKILNISFTGFCPHWWVHKTMAGAALHFRVSSAFAEAWHFLFILISSIV